MKNSFFVTLLITSLLASCSTAKKMSSDDRLFTAEIGVQAYSFRNYFPKDMIGTLDRIQSMGITLIEGDGGKIPPTEFKKLCADRGIRIPSTGCSFEELASDPQAVADKAKALGASYVMVAWVPHNGDFTKADADKAIEVFEKGGKVLADNGITFAYHAHGYEFQPYGKATLLEYIIENTNPKYVSFEMDTLWIHFGGGDPAALLRKYPNRWKLMHVKDLKKGTLKDLTGGTSVENDVVVGTGELNFSEILRAAKDVGVVYYFIEDESSSVMNQVPQTIAYLKSLKK